MKKTLHTYLRSIICSCALLLLSISSYASHIVAAELRYKWVSGLTYDVTVYLYGDCGPDSRGSFSTLPGSTPRVCIYNGATSVGFVDCPIVLPTAGVEVTPVCPDSFAFTQCTNTSFALPGIKKFVYTGRYTLPSTSSVWRFVYEGYNGSGSASGRAAAITNLFSPGSTLIQLVDTLNNSVTNTRGHNSSPVLTVEPVPYFCRPSLNCFNPGTVDLYDVSPSQPAGDSLVFSLIAAQNGSGSNTCPPPGPFWTYVGSSCVGTPVSGTRPLTVTDCTPASFSFNSNTGQLCFDAPVDQRSTVVYNIEEFRDDTVAPGIVNHVMVGTMQREMTFRVSPCMRTSPEGGIDDFTGGGHLVDSFHYSGCANSGTFTLTLHPHVSDPTLRISVTVTGLSAGIISSVAGDGTSTPTVTLTGNTSVIAPGNYIVYITYTDSHCPLVGSKTYPILIDVLPVPTLTDSIITPATCSDKATVRIIPGGTGKPWTIKISRRPPLVPYSALDTFQVFNFDTSAFADSLARGKYYATIFTSVSNECAVTIPITVDTPHFDITADSTNPTYCGAADGSIRIYGLNPGHLDTIFYDYQGLPQTPVGVFVSPSGTDTLFNLLAGSYSNIKVLEGYCLTFAATPNPQILINPPFTWRTVTTKDATKCGFCNGVDTLFGMHPSQLDTVKYSFRPKYGTTFTPYTLSHFINADSMFVISGLCAGDYTNFTVNTAGVCSYTVPGTFVIDQPEIHANFSDVIHYGCNGDTVMFTNLSTHDGPIDSVLSYTWSFGDGINSIFKDPKHIYTNTIGATYIVRLLITNTKCVDSSFATILLDNYVNSGFDMMPNPFVCQDSIVTFTSTATGTNLSYLWDFGDGNTDITPNPTHTFLNSGNYKIKLIVADHVVPTPAYFMPCYDTVIRNLAVDSISNITLNATDTVICMGQAITFAGIYAHIGDTLTTWSFGDGNATVNTNPIIHSFEADSLFTVSVNVKYRACPETTATRQVRVFNVPSVYLGPDTAICPGGIAITLRDERNMNNPKASWKWNTGEKTSSISVVKPGNYYSIVTIDGCTSSDTLTVNKDCYMDIPNVFTPNGDGVNDYFFPRQFLTRGLATFKMAVYNRWGQTVYETNLPDGRGWDGKFNDISQPQGVYIYMIDATFKDGQIEHHQGNVTLLK